MKRKVSVVMCTYNGEKFLEEQLKSILNQTYPIYELIIQDDGSIDKSMDILRKFSQNNANICVFRNKKRKGFRANFSSAIDLASGDFIALSDQDDIWDRNKIEILLSYLINKKYSLVHSDATLIDKQGGILYNSFFTYSSIPVELCFDDYLFGKNNVTGCTCMFTADLKKYIYPFPSFYYYHDAWIALIVKRFGCIYFCPKTLVAYRQHDSNVIGVGKNKRTSLKELFNKGLDMFFLLKLRKKLSLNQKQIFLLLRYGFTSVIGLAYLRIRLRNILEIRK